MKQWWSEMKAYKIRNNQIDSQFLSSNFGNVRAKGRNGILYLCPLTIQRQNYTIAIAIASQLFNNILASYRVCNRQYVLCTVCQIHVQVHIVVFNNPKCMHACMHECWNQWAIYLIWLVQLLFIMWNTWFNFHCKQWIHYYYFQPTAHFDVENYVTLGWMCVELITILIMSVLYYYFHSSLIDFTSTKVHFDKMEKWKWRRRKNHFHYVCVSACFVQCSSVRGFWYYSMNFWTDERMSLL